MALGVAVTNKRCCSGTKLTRLSSSWTGEQVPRPSHSLATYSLYAGTVDHVKLALRTYKPIHHPWVQRKALTLHPAALNSKRQSRSQATNRQAVKSRSIPALTSRASTSGMILARECYVVMIPANHINFCGGYSCRMSVPWVDYTM
jgi:hypothetical protein